MPAKTNTLKKAPFSGDGSLHRWAPTWGEGDNLVWRANEPFDATLRIDHLTTGVSAKYVTWRPVDPKDVRRFPMFVADLLDLLQHAERVERGVVSAQWQVRKRGQKYGLCLAVPT